MKTHQTTRALAWFALATIALIPTLSAATLKVGDAAPRLQVSQLRL